MSDSVLFVLTSHAQLGDTGQKTGTWLEELAAAYYVLVDAGYDVALASVRGGAAPLDPASLDDPWLTDAGRRFQADAKASGALATTARLADVSPDGFDAIYFVGGAGAAWDFPVDADVRRLAEGVDRAGGIVSGVCHGVLGLTTAQTLDGQPLVAGREVTAVSNKEEELTTFDKVVPVLPESRLVELGGRYGCAAEPFGAYVAVDGNLVTGQNPASAPFVARVVAERLSARADAPA
ncbi:MAG: type 1 glutamine amidotransferase domain-containing protein [Sphingomonadales bacterium]|nr:type 1 glutamine amidotransferase domain-containing protein [Sphingomonadales bacterium]